MTVAATEAIMAINIHHAKIFLALLLITILISFFITYIIYHIFTLFSIYFSGEDNETD